jgi:hypothetical protein
MTLGGTGKSSFSLATLIIRGTRRFNIRGR